MWDIPASIKVSMYADRIEISSPGGLPAGISEEEYLNGQISILRNPIIGNVFFRLKYIEKFGTGIMRINHAYRNALIKPSYQCFSYSIKVILPFIRENYDLSEAEQILVSILKGKEKMSRSEIEKAAEMEKSKEGTVTATFKKVPKGTWVVGMHAFNRTSEDGKKVFSPWSNLKKATVK